MESIENIIEKNYGTEVSLIDFVVMQTSEDKIWVVSKDFSSIDSKRLAVNSIGMDFGKLKNGKLHLSIEGCQIVGKDATRNIIEVSKEDGTRFLKGETLKTEKISNCDLNNFVIIKSLDDFVGSGMLTVDGIMNLTPKSRRLPL